MRRLAALAAAALVAVAVLSLPASGGSTPRAAGQVVIPPGGTLWDVAVRHAPPGSDPRVYVAHLIELNGLHGARVDPWMVVRLPAE